MIAKNINFVKKNILVKKQGHTKKDFQTFVYVFHNGSM